MFTRPHGWLVDGGPASLMAMLMTRKLVVVLGADSVSAGGCRVCVTPLIAADAAAPVASAGDPPPAADRLWTAVCWAVLPGTLMQYYRVQWF